jgi:hypothetical protein
MLPKVYLFRLRSNPAWYVPYRQSSARCMPVFEELFFNACQPNLDVRSDPAFFPELMNAPPTPVSSGRSWKVPKRL